MNVTELVEAMHSSAAPGSPDLTRISRDGRRITVRRHAGLTAGIAAVVVATAAPWLVLTNQGHGDGSKTGQVADQLDSVETRFETTAPLGAPLGGVAQTDMKFYLGPQHTRSVGALALWSEADIEPTRIAYGARLIDGDKTLRRKGFVDVPILPPVGVRLAKVPGQNKDEPTFVGMVSVPAGATAADYLLRVRSDDTTVTLGSSVDVIKGYLLIWMTATAGSEPGIALKAFTVREVGGDVVARGTFAR